MTRQPQPVFRFAPSPNGFLHLGHAYSALLNADAAARTGGRLLLRIEDIDLGRSRERFVDAILEDLAWLGFHHETPVRRQSRHFAEYAAALEQLKALGVVYPCRCSRAAIASVTARLEQERATPWPRDPDGQPLYPGTCRNPETRTTDGEQPAWQPAWQPVWRLDMAAALETALGKVASPLGFTAIDSEGRATSRAADPALWGDVVLARRDTPTSYHLSVVVDDALQGVTDVIRGRDLEAATDIHVLLQRLLGLPTPVYRFHPLILDEHERKLSKSRGSPALRDLRSQGLTPADIRRRLGFTV
jgi:glutamyl-Q tRNA(Asp) synthetase